jgi:hypothetical protein
VILVRIIRGSKAFEIIIVLETLPSQNVWKLIPPLILNIREELFFKFIENSIYLDER